MSDIASPCVDVCRLQDGVCQGCFRDIGEIARWRAANDAEKRAILARAAARRERNEFGAPRR
ncbi:MAG TPA: DUF1289 domain-containing protein [Gammaproteobacteria bacterium]|nr:DUF1289 domain-containing protein [Gammaproteobacteria bacterium]